MCKRSLLACVTTMAVALLPTSPVIAQQSESNETTKPPPIVAHVKGVLLDAHSKPIADKKIYLLFYSEGERPVTLPGGVYAIQHSRTVTHSLAEGKIINPSAATDSSGAFLIPLRGKDAGSRFALGYIEGDRSTAIQRLADRGWVIVEVPDPAVDMDLGTLVTRTKSDERSD